MKITPYTSPSTNNLIKFVPNSQIFGAELKALMVTQAEFVLLDARGTHWHDGNKIPGALLAWYEDPAEFFEKIIPTKQSLVVVYCYSSTCPLGPRLSQRLIELGYENVVQYPGGLKEWHDVDHYPVELIQR